MGEVSSSVGRIGEVITLRSYSSSASESWYVGGIAILTASCRSPQGHIIAELKHRAVVTGNIWDACNTRSLVFTMRSHRTTLLLV